MDESILRRWESYFPMEFDTPLVLGGDAPFRITYSDLRKGHRAGKRVWDFTCPFHAEETFPKERIFSEFDHLIEDQGYLLVPNAFPVDKYHFLLVHHDHVSMEERRKDMVSDLEMLMRFSKETGAIIAHNSRRAGASIPNHEHYHAFVQHPPLLYMGREELPAPSWCHDASMSYLPKKEGLCLVFSGEGAPQAAEETLTRLEEMFTTERTSESEGDIAIEHLGHNHVVTSDSIYLFPRKRREVDLSPYMSTRRCGSNELLRYFPLAKKDHVEYFKTDEGAKRYSSSIAQVLFPHEVLQMLLDR